MENPSWKEVWETRARVYAFLGNTLLSPMAERAAQGIAPGFWEEFPLEPANEHMQSALESLVDVAASLAERPREEAVRDVAVEYTKLFIGPGAPPVPLWESLYREGGRYLFGQPTFDMRQIFREHGFRLNESVKQFEDHLGVELLFLSAMSSRFAAANPSREAVAEQAAFIEQHPLWWVGKAQALAEEHGTVGFYQAILELAWGVLLWDRDLLAEYVQDA